MVTSMRAKLSSLVKDLDKPVCTMLMYGVAVEGVGDKSYSKIYID